MNVTREVILDLFPVYLSGEAAPATRALVEEFLKHDSELAQRLRLQWADNFAAALPSSLPPELELRSLRRTRKLLTLRTWILSIAIFCTLVPFSLEMNLSNWRVTEFHFLIRDYPEIYGTFLAVGLLCWAAYFLIRRQLRATPR